MKRPLLLPGLLYVAGILIGNFVSVPLAILLPVSLAVALLAIVWSKARHYLLYPLLFLTGWTGFAFHTATISPHDLLRVLGANPEIVTVRGTLSETPTVRVSETGGKTSWYTMARVDVSAL